MYTESFVPVDLIIPSFWHSDHFDASRCRSQQPKEVQEAFEHLPYITILPRDSLTAVYFSHEELDLLRGSNLYHATHERRSQWHDQWERSKAWLKSVEGVDGKWAIQFSW
jgi:hypothetical protein